VSENVHEKFTGPFQRILLQNVGHFPQREDPESTAKELAMFLDVSVERL
jgi:pimeloyl-ACP methyl ester carboxylesterase